MMNLYGIRSKLNANSIKIFRSKFWNKSQRNSIEKKFQLKITSYYNKHRDSELDYLCTKYGSDKGWLGSAPFPYSWKRHSYTDFYSKIFQFGRHDIRKILEIGIGTNNPNLPSSMGLNGKPGASLRVWRDYFPNATVFGADIDKEILFTEERIKTFWVDQLNPRSIQDLCFSIGISDFDIIIDDGLHSFESGTTLFSGLINYLSSNGIYIIEDVSRYDLLRFQDYFINSSFIVNYVVLEDSNLELEDNILITIQRTNC